MKTIGKVICSNENEITVQIDSIDIFEQHKEDIHVGRYLVIDDGNLNKIFGVIKNIETSEKIINSELILLYIVKVTPLGSLVEEEGKFSFVNGGTNIPSPTELVSIASKEIIDTIFSKNGKYNFNIGTLATNNTINYYVNGNNFFGKHSAIVGSTGSGKSCAVASIIQNVLRIKEAKNQCKSNKINSHIIIYDLHSEYKHAFELVEEENFSLNNLDVDKLVLPYWLMNSSELESLFIESNEFNSYNQISQFKKAVILSKTKHNPGAKVTYDTPVYFDINEVLMYIKNKNNEVINKVDTDYGKPIRKDRTIINDPDTVYIDEVVEFASTSTSKDSKASNGPYNGEFERFITRLENKLSDKRLDFILKSYDDKGNLLKTEGFENILKQIIGYINNSNITILDLSGIPFEVLSIVISLFSRIVFDFCFNYSKIKHFEELNNDIPYTIVCEEAHNYIPRNGGAEYNSSKLSIERIAKEGRKYGLNLMIVSQRPSELSETILSQCNNFVVLKLTNVNDQNYIKKLLPDNNSSLVDNLPCLSAGEALVVGDAVSLPSIIKLPMPNPQPSSENVNVYDEWNEPWKAINFDPTIDKWLKG